jgi:hypothetical protein
LRSRLLMDARGGLLQLSRHVAVRNRPVRANWSSSLSYHLSSPPLSASKGHAVSTSDTGSFLKVFDRPCGIVSYLAAPSLRARRHIAVSTSSTIPQGLRTMCVFRRLDIFAFRNADVDCQTTTASTAFKVTFSVWYPGSSQCHPYCLVALPIALRKLW